MYLETHVYVPRNITLERLQRTVQTLPLNAQPESAVSSDRTNFRRLVVSYLYIVWLSLGLFNSLFVLKAKSGSLTACFQAIQKEKFLLCSLDLKR